ncbi:MAG: M20/M25/M40 family metallo-hydrolase, partial [Nannocystaceae bacterium]|nr:M20/M25/M40 family metallo-hydrolase [Nannocystaceae bacterium]
MSRRAALFIPVWLVLCLACGPKGDVPTSIPPVAGDPRSTDATADDDDFEEDDDEIPEVDGDAVVKSIVRLGHTDNHVTDHVAYLTQDIGPRLTGSHRLMEAEQWCRDQFASWGLTAHLERWGDFPVGFDRGPWSGGMVSPEEIDFDFITPAWTPGVIGPLRGLATLYPKTLKELKRRKAEFAGAWVVRPRKWDIERKLRDKLDAALADLKVAGLVVADRNAAGELVHTYGKSQIQWAELPSQVVVNLRADQHGDLVERLGESQKVELAFSIDNRFFNGPVPQHNVIADIVGTEKPEEIVVVGGHLDSWDGATGANDNGTGVATTMEAARLLMAAGAKPKRTIRFILWSGEEQGLLGSKGYVEAHGEQMDKFSAVLVHDGGTNYLSGIGVTPEMMPQMTAVFAPVLQLSPDERPFEVTEVPSLQPGGSDHSPFIHAGVPGFFWDQAGDSDYGRVHHTQHDTLANVVEEYQRHSAMVVAIAAYQLANLPELVERRNSAPLPRRRIGGMIDSKMVVDDLDDDGLGAKAGLKLGDKILSLDGKTYDNRWEAFRATQVGGPRKTLVIERNGKEHTIVLDWTGSEGEVQRAER